jgi:TonB family protein
MRFDLRSCQQMSAPRLRYLAALSFSVLLHGGLCVLVARRTTSKPRVANHRPLELELVGPRRAASEAPRLRAQARPAHGLASPTSVAPRAAQSSAPLAGLAPGESSARAAADVGGVSPGDGGDAHDPSDVQLFRGEAIQEAALGERALSAAELGQRRLDRWSDEYAAFHRAQTEGARGAALELERRMSDWFLPETETLERASLLGLGAASVLVPMINDMATDGRPRQDSPWRINLDAADGRAGVPLTCLLGDCRNRGSVVASLFVVIQIDHDEEGAPAAWRVLQSSGVKAFDAEAVAAVQTAARQHPESYSEPPIPAWSRWEFLVEANRYARHSLILDPGFVAPGKEIASDVLGKTTLVRRVRLVAITYRKAEPVRSSTDR